MFLFKMCKKMIEKTIRIPHFYIKKLCSIFQITVSEPPTQFSGNTTCWTDGDPRLKTFDDW